MALYVVTGGAGFIGSHLTDRLLERGHRVRAVDDLSTGHRHNLDKRAELVVGDVADAALMRSAMQGADGCFHLAAIASVARANEDWTGTNRCNLGGTVAVLDAARAAGRIPVVYASSAAVYGDQQAEVMQEALAPRPLSAYGADKLGSELHARVAFLVHGVPTLGFRFFNVYGPRQDPRSPYSGVISIFAERIAAGQTIRVDGDGGQTRDFIYVADIVRHLLAGMERLHATPEARVLNACTGRATSILALAATLGGIAGRRPQIVHAPARAGDIRASLGDPAAARAVLGVAAETPLADGLAATLRSLAPVPEQLAA
jgi:UDP-glucose 4-epimerase